MKINPVALFALYLLAHIGLFHAVHGAGVIPEKWGFNLFWGCFLASFAVVFIFAKSPERKSK